MFFNVKFWYEFNKLDWISLCFVSNAYGIYKKGKKAKVKDEDKEEKEKQQGLHKEEGWKLTEIRTKAFLQSIPFSGLLSMSYVKSC